MTEAWAYAGAGLLVGATLPQAARLLRTRRADDLAWSFIGLNFAGIGLLALRSAELGEAAFVAVNLATASFWALAAAVKAQSIPRPGWFPRRATLRMAREETTNPGDVHRPGQVPP